MCKMTGTGEQQIIQGVSPTLATTLNQSFITDDLGVFIIYSKPSANVSQRRIAAFL